MTRDTRRSIQAQSRTVLRSMPGIPLILVLWLRFVCSSSLAQTTSPSPQQVKSKQAQPRAWTVPAGVAFGDLNRLKLLPCEEYSDDGGEESVLVATRAVGLNFADVFTLLGYYKAANLVRTDHNNAFVPGLEFSGVVLEDCGDFCKGDKVYGFTRFGAYSDLVRAKPSALRKLPSNWSFQEGAAFLVNALTAWYGLVTVAGMPDCHRTQPLQEESCVVVIHSAAGGVGLWASEIAARRGALVVGIVGHESKVQTFYQRIRPLVSICSVLGDDATIVESLHTAWHKLFVEHDPMLLAYQYPNGRMHKI